MAEGQPSRGEPLDTAQRNIVRNERKAATSPKRLHSLFSRDKTAGGTSVVSILIRRLDLCDPGVTPFAVKFVHNMDKTPRPRPYHHHHQRHLKI